MTELKDFNDLLARSIAEKRVFGLVQRWRGDSGLSYSIGGLPVTVLPEALFEGVRGDDSIEHVWKLARREGKEVPFVLLMDAETLHLHACCVGVPGTPGFCSWEDGTLLADAFALACKNRQVVVLGHTHPEKYGALCSNVYYRESDPYGGDYLDLAERHVIYPDVVSDLACILNPYDAQLGFFRVLPEGRIAYHPWLVAYYA